VGGLQQVPRYRVRDGKITKVTLRRIKTWFTGKEVLLVDNCVVGTIDLRELEDITSPSAQRLQEHNSRISSYDPSELAAAEIGSLFVSLT
jgi:hypothetical protein